MAIRGHDIDVTNAEIGIEGQRTECVQMSVPTPVLPGVVEASPGSTGITHWTHYGAVGDATPTGTLEEGALLHPQTGPRPRCRTPARRREGDPPAGWS
eukprot:10015951-Alexandrium_andersonii.AAC.1